MLYIAKYVSASKDWTELWLPHSTASFDSFFHALSISTSFKSKINKKYKKIH